MNLDVDFSLLLYNCTGARTKLDNIRAGMQMLDLKIAILTETWLKQGALPPKGCIAVSTSNASGKKRGFAGTCFFIPDKGIREKARTIAIDEENGRFSVIQIENMALAAVYLSPLTPLEECIETITTVINVIEKSKCSSVILAGDFNLRHESIGSFFSCKRGQELIPRIESIGFQCINDGKPTHLRDGWSPSILDLVFTRNIQSGQASPVESLYLGKSHHIPVIFKTQFKIQKKVKKFKEKFNLAGTDDKQKRASFEIAMKEKIQSLEDKVEEITAQVREGHFDAKKEQLSAKIDEVDNSLSQHLYATARNTFGMIRHKPPREEPTENELTRELFSNIQAAHSEKDHERIDKLNKPLMEERRAIKKESFRKYCMEICEMPRSQQVSRISKMARAMNVGSQGGLNEDTSTLEAAAAHFSGIFNSIAPNRHPGFAWESDKEVAWDLSRRVFSFDRVLHSILSLPCKKAGGASGVVSELLQLCEPVSLTKFFMKFFSLCLCTGLVPASWKKAVIVPVPKKGDLSMLSNYRPISLLEVLRKCYEKCILIHIQEEMNAGRVKKLSDEQGGFRAGRSTLDQCAILHELITASKKKFKSHPCVGFLDIKAAYDSVDRSILFEKCSRNGMLPQIVETLRQLFDFNSACIQIGGSKSRSFKMKAGVQQGSLLSPILYSIFLDDIKDKLQKGPGLKFKVKPTSTKDMMTPARKINALLYADDIAVIGKNKEELQGLLNLALEFAAENNFKFNANKCVWTGEKDEKEIFLEETKMKMVASFEYLGITFSKKGIDANKHIERLCCNARKIYFTLQRIGFNGQGFSTNSNILIYKTIIRPRLEYGLQITKFTKTNLDKIEASQHEFICGAFSIGKNSSRTALRVLGRVEPMQMRVNILNERFRVRVIRLTATGNSFLGVILWLLVNAWGFETYICLQ